MTEDLPIIDENDNSVVKTICRDCIFAVWMNVRGGYFSDEQTGCSLGRLSKFDGIKQQKEGNETFYEIPRLCNCCRNKEWEKQSTKSIEERLAEENAPQVNLIVLVKEKHSKQEIDTTIKQIKAMEHKPFSVVFACCTKTQLLYIANMAKHLRLENIKYYISHIQYDYTDANMINQAFLKCNGQYYATIYAGRVFDIYFIQGMDYLINQELYQISLMHNYEEGLESLENAAQTEKLINSYNPYVVQNALHKILGGYGKHTVFNKILALAKEQGKEEMLWSWDNLAKEELCNQE